MTDLCFFYSFHSKLLKKLFVSKDLLLKINKRYVMIGVINAFGIKSEKSKTNTLQAINNVKKSETILIWHT